ncbi:hypothetical protein LX32DRAFT_357577 [Colletotrichum zoysiae]|uniref:Uncharacterized protein n=1 Tax=Colletotrichum zoysiae TaxID=1216348 RepID=A0AAD9HKB3_9PEZI|nr:hypothetical protein LX32DRAFT_357577 [Colletotrichum zoysiae]
MESWGRRLRDRNAATSCLFVMALNNSQPPSKSESCMKGPASLSHAVETRAPGRSTLFNRDSLNIFLRQPRGFAQSCFVMARTNDPSVTESTRSKMRYRRGRIAYLRAPPHGRAGHVFARALVPGPRCICSQHQRGGSQSLEGPTTRVAGCR